MTVWVGSASGNKQLLDPKVGSTGGTRRDVQVIYVGTAAGNKLVYQRIPTMTLTTTAVGWDQINLSWPAGGTGISYELLRNGVSIYSGAATSYSDTLRLPSTTYNYTLRTMSGTNVLATSTASRATPAHGGISVTASTVNTSTIAVRWTDADQRSIDHYKLYRWTGAWTVVDDGADKAHDEGGLPPGTNQTYFVQAFRGTTYIGPDSNQAVGGTAARTYSTGTVVDGGVGNSSWTECTQKALTSHNFTMPGSAYMYDIDMNVAGYSPEGGRFNPKIDGTWYGWFGCGASLGYSTSYWSHARYGNPGDDGNPGIWLGGGAHSLGADVGGDCNKTQWRAYAGGAYQSTIALGTVYYWYWNSTLRDAELRTQPWWREELAEREIHIESTAREGETVAVKIYDKRTKSVLVEWAKGD